MLLGIIEKDAPAALYPAAACALADLREVGHSNIIYPYTPVFLIVLKLHAVLEYFNMPRKCTILSKNIYTHTLNVKL